MTQAVTYDQFRYDVYLVKHTGGRLIDQPVIANFGSEALVSEFAKWYSDKHNAQLCINDLKTDEVRYHPEMKELPKGAMPPQDGHAVHIGRKNYLSEASERPLAATAPKHERKHDTEGAAVIEAKADTAAMSTRDLAKMLLEVIKASKPLPARKVAEKAALEYDIHVRRTLCKLRDTGRIIFDNGRWRVPTEKEKVK